MSGQFKVSMSEASIRSQLILFFFEEEEAAEIILCLDLNPH